tara:strand:+ start:1127 stop:1744 length:618 start_codon:yes stop_codon:yes gene_type:complete
MNELKTRERNSEELFLRKKGLFEIKNIFDNSNIPFFVWGGLLLGIRRDNNFIKWDWDVELGLFEKDLRLNWIKIIQLLEKNSFEIIEKDYFNSKINFIKYADKDTTIFSLVGWRYDFITRNYIRKKLSVPKVFFSKMYAISFENKKFLCPGPVDEFLKYFYGDWKKPIKTSKKNDYLSKSINKKNLWMFYTVIQKIIFKVSGAKK